MNTLTSFAYPHFAAGQVLKSSDLNGIIQYVDRQDATMRTRLIGAGVLYGLEVGWDGNNKKLTISMGIGLTSQGDMLYLDTQQEFTHFISLPLKRKQIVGGADSSEIKGWKLGNIDAMGNTGQLLSHEFLTTSSNNPDDDCTNNRCAKCVLLLKESKTATKSGGCFNGFETQTEEVVDIVSVYLVDRKFFNEFHKIPTLPDRKTLFDGLPKPFLNRLGFKDRKLSLEGIVGVASFKEAYNQVCTEAIVSIVEAFTALAKADGPGRKLDADINFDDLQTTLNSSLTSATNEQLSYFYEFLEDLVRGYEELVCLEIYEKKYEVNAAWFPKYLLLGGFGANASECRTPAFCAPVCSDGSDILFQKAQFLYRRLAALVENWVSGNLPAVPKITPSKRYCHPLSERAIPFYYKIEIRPKWSFELFHKGKSDTIPHYTSADNALPPHTEHLLYDLEHWGFFRVEGQAGMAVVEALDKIKEERKRLNVSFDVVCVALSGETANPWPDTHFDDLETAYHQLRLEWMADLSSREGDSWNDIHTYLGGVSVAKLYRLDLLEFKEKVSQAEDGVDKCRLQVVEFLHGSWETRVRPPVFKDFAAMHPGLEHLGGVQPGGTLVLVYENDTMLVDPTTGELPNAPTVVADFCLPYQCCVKPQPIPSTLVLCCFPWNALCQHDGPREIFTYPEGGRVVASVGGKYYPGVTAISPDTGKWQFVPERLSAEVFDEVGEVDVALEFINLGRKTEPKTVKVGRLVVGFKATAQWVNSSLSLIKINISDISPTNAALYDWKLTFLKNDEPLAGPTTMSFDNNQVPFQNAIDIQQGLAPNFAQIALLAKRGVCSARHEVIIPIDFQPDETQPRGKEEEVFDAGEATTPPATKKTSKTAKKESVNKEETTKGGPGPGASTSDPFQAMDIQSDIAERQKLDKSNLAALRPVMEKQTLFQRVNLFLMLPGLSENTSRFYKEISEELLDAMAGPDEEKQAEYRSLLDILNHSYFAKLFTDEHGERVVETPEAEAEIPGQGPAFKPLFMPSIHLK